MIFVFGLAFLIINIYNKVSIKNLIRLCLIISSISFLIMIFENSNRPDGGLYHLPFISILNEHKIILGISNIHFRFAHTSIIQYTSAVFNNSFFSEKRDYNPNFNYNNDNIFLFL